MKVFARSPVRLGLGGGGTDIADYYLKYGGEVLNVTINHYIYCTAVHTELNDICVSLDLNKLEKSTDEEKTLVLHWAALDVVREHYDLPNLPVKLETFTDIPVGSGLGTSSSMVVCIIEALSRLHNLNIGKNKLVELAYFIERKICKLAGGMQDYIAAAYGGLNFTEFSQDGSYLVTPLRLTQGEKALFEQSCILVSTGTSRVSSDIINDQQNAFEDPKKLQAMHEIKDNCYGLRKSLVQGSYDEFFRLMHLAWSAKKATSNKMTNALINDLENIINGNGAAAMKVSGAGGGGFVQVFANPDEMIKIRAELKDWDVRSVGIIDHGVQSWMKK